MDRMSTAYCSKTGLARVYDSPFSLRDDFYKSEATYTVTNESCGPSRDLIWTIHRHPRGSQMFFETNTPDEEPYRLDRDEDGVPFESLP